MKKVLAIGELLIDFVPQQKGCALSEVTHFERVAGGAPANVALAASRLGGESVMVSQVGMDAFGDYIIHTLQAGGVDTRYIFRTAKANTGLAFVSLDASGNREFSFYRNPSADLFLDEAQLTPDMFADVGVLRFCSVDLVDRPVKQAHRKAVRLAQDAGAIVSFDPNVRLPLWDSPESCQAAIREFLPFADLVKLSDNEIEFVTGLADEREAAGKLLAGGCGMVLVTKGSNGASAYTAQAEAHAPAQPAKVVDTTGAGDCFAGSFLYQLLRDNVSRETLGAQDAGTLAGYLDYAARCAAFTCARKGASMPARDDVK